MPRVEGMAAKLGRVLNHGLTARRKMRFIGVSRWKLTGASYGLRDGREPIVSTISRLSCASGGTIAELNWRAGRRERKIQ